MERRRFLRYVAAVPAFGLAGCRRKVRQPVSRSKPAAVTARCVAEQRTAERARVLSATEWETIEAACARILPSDDDPGAAEAGVINFVDAQLAHPPVANFLPLLRMTSRYLDAVAKKRGATSFARLKPAQQDQLLRKVEQGRVGRHAGSRVLRVLLALTVEGFFGDPVYGGNRDGVGWKMIGFEPQQPGPRCPYRSLA